MAIHKNKTLKKRTKVKRTVPIRTFKIKKQNSRLQKNLKRLVQEEKKDITINIKILTRFEKFFKRLIKLVDKLYEYNNHINMNTEVEISVLLETVYEKLKNMERKHGSIFKLIKNKHPKLYAKLELNEKMNINNNSYSKTINKYTDLIEKYIDLIEELSEIYEDVNTSNDILNDISIIQLTLVSYLKEEFFSDKDENEDDDLVDMFKQLSVKKNIAEDVLDMFKNIKI